MVERLLATCAQARLVSRILHKKKDPTMQKSLYECLLTSQNMDLRSVSYSGFLEWLSHSLEESFTAAAESSSMLKQAFEGEYPKLLRLSNDLLKRLNEAADMQRSDQGLTGLTVSGAEDEDDFSAPTSLLNFLVKFENAYLSRSLSRLFDPIELAFSASNVPNAEEVANIVRTMASEMSFATGDRDLLAKVGSVHCSLKMLHLHMLSRS